jgi:replicative DNA helicase
MVAMAQSPTATVPPQNLEAEASVLGAMLITEPALTRAIDDVKLRPEDFYLDKHRLIFAAIFGLYEGSKPVDVLTLIEALNQRAQIEDAGGKHYVSELAAKVPAAGNAKHYAEIVQQNALLRRLLGAGQRIQESVRERDGDPRQLAENAERLLFEVAHEEQAGDFRQLNEILGDELDRLEKLSSGESELTGTASGFKDIDALTGGFQPGNLIVIAARPSMGKSAWVANIAENVAVKKNTPVAFFSLEMSEVELAQRFIACRARIPGDRLRKGQVAQKDWPKVVRACQELEQAPLWFDDSSDLGILDLRAKARRLHAQQQANGGLGLIIVDYLQLMRADDARANRVEQVGQMSRGLKILARELDVPVIGISQLSRAPEQRTPPRPILSDLRESGQIEQDADVVAFLYREDAYGQRDPDYEPTGIAEVIFAKHRNGPVGTKRMVFLDRFPKFADYSGQDTPVEQPAGEGPPLADATAAEGPSF